MTVPGVAGSRERTEGATHMRHAIRHDEELRLLGDLYRELVCLGMKAGVRDALPGLTVTTDVPGVPLYVFVSESGRTFDWHNAAMRHPVDDTPGAARRIVAFLRGESAVET
jgi:hypothetical protein